MASRWGLRGFPVASLLLTRTPETDPAHGAGQLEAIQRGGDALGGRTEEGCGWCWESVEAREWRCGEILQIGREY